MASDRTVDAREALIAACLTLSLGFGHADKVRIVLEDVTPHLAGALTREDEQNLLHFAQEWLAASNTADRLSAEQRIRWLAQDIYLMRMVNAHDRQREALGLNS